MNAVEKIRAGQQTIDVLLKRGTIVFDKNKINDKWKIEVIYQSPDASIGFAKCGNTSIGDFPSHMHGDSREYLICASGSVMIYLNNEALRLLKPGDCAAIPANSLHFSRPLEPNTKLIYVCVPWDENFSDNGK